ncbi:hypothetical protein [Pseudomonas putida]
MTQAIEPRAWLIKHYPTFIGVILLACIAIGCGVVLVAQTYFSRVPISGGKGLGIYLGIMGFGVLIILSHFLMARGRAWAVWGVVLSLSICLLFTLPAIFYDAHRGVYLTAVVSGLLGLLLLSTSRHREMRRYFVWLRQQREGADD